jgi:hypothetical protein
MNTAQLTGILCIICLLPVCSISQAQESQANFYDQPYKERNNGTFNKGTQIFALGYGLGNTSGTGYLNINLNEKISHTNVGPVYLKYEYGLAEAIGLGVYGCYAYAKDRMNHANPKDYTTHAISFGINGFYHFNKVVHVENLDLYAGLGLGFKSLSIRSQLSDGSGTPDKLKDNTGVFSLRLGARYYIVSGFGAYFEFGPDKMSALNVGLSYKW